MKPSPKKNFSLSVRRQSWEEEPELAYLYDGIFDVTINGSFSVMFVPEMRRESLHWPPLLPENVDTITTPEAARQVTIALSRYTVTPDSELAGREEQFARDAVSPHPATIFYVTPEEFAQFTEELGRLADERPAVHRGWESSEVSDLAVYKFLETRVFRSPWISSADLAMVER